MRKNTVTVGGRTLHLEFGVPAYIELEKHFGSHAEFRRRTGENDNPYEAYVTLVCVCANNGARRRGEPQDMTTDWLMDNLSKREMDRAISAAISAYVKGSSCETLSDEDEDVDVVAEEIEKKEEAPAET